MEVQHGVSNPHRYGQRGKPGGEERYQAALFQTLIGTVKGDPIHAEELDPETAFQTLIGTVKGDAIVRDPGPLPLVFQTLIGTVKGGPS